MSECGDTVRQGEPVAWAWKTKRAGGEWLQGWALGHIRPTRENCHLKDDDELKLHALTFIGNTPATPQDSIPAWAWRQAITDFYTDCGTPLMAAYMDQVESRARELAASQMDAPTADS